MAPRCVMMVVVTPTSSMASLAAYICRVVSGERVSFEHGYRLVYDMVMARCGRAGLGEVLRQALASSLGSQALLAGMGMEEPGRVQRCGRLLEDVFLYAVRTIGFDARGVIAAELARHQEQQRRVKAQVLAIAPLVQHNLLVMDQVYRALWQSSAMLA